ncbi:MAG: ABC transporter ATP-binding protein/permease [Chloroflexi bacterium]|nr:ABC transporter ATP-binding protein/permease [Chloroflexota bacterium]
MLRLIKYLKPYTLMIVVTIAMLFAQANFDLALPDYLSKIVNVGIQQGGVESAVPQALRQSKADQLVLFMSEQEKTDVLANYTLVQPGTTQAEAYLDEYPALTTEAVYILNDVDEETHDRLNPVMGRAFLAVSTIEKLMKDPSAATELGTITGFDLSTIPAGADLFGLLEKLPAAQLQQMAVAMDEKFTSMGESMVTQAAVEAVRAEYDALGMNTGTLQTNYIVRMGGWMLLISLGSVVCSVVVSYFSGRTSSGSARDIRRDVFKKVESFSSAEFNQFSTASLITRTTNDITQIQMLVMMMMRMVFFAPIMGVGGVIRALSKSASMWYLIAIAVVLLIGMIMLVFSLALPKFKIMQKLIDKLNLVARESLSGMMVIRAFNMQKFEEDRFDKANSDLTALSLYINRVMTLMSPMMMMIMNGLTLAIMWVGAHQVAQASMQVGDMMAFMQYAMQIIFSFMMLSFMFIILPRASVSADRIADVLETKPVIRDPQDPKHFGEPFRASVEFRNVSFRYPDAESDVLHDISFTSQPGQTTAFIGSTGSGKSTIVNLVPRFFDVTDGQILIDGIDIRDVSQNELRDRIGFVPQKGVLFSGTIESNLRYGDENADADRLKAAAETAQATEFIFSNPEGLAAEIAQGGTNVSGGQKQRLSIARALVKQPPIYIFDDSFSALDFKTDAALRKALKQDAASSTILIVTQRVSTIKNAEQIIVLEEGKIVGKGSHAELMENCPTYKEIAMSQLSLEELL